jgi:hypothetical protein
MAGGKQEDATRLEAERELEALERELHREQRQRKTSGDRHQDPKPDDNA